MAVVQDKPALDARAADLHARAIVIDGQTGGTVVNPALALSGGVTASVLTLEQRPDDDFTAAGKQVAKHLDFLEYYKDQVLQVWTADDILRAKRERKLGLIFGFQTPTVVGSDRTLLAVFQALGIRYMQLTYMDQVLTGSGCLEPHDRGLTAFGLRLIREMERLGVLLDLSHVGRRTSLDALQRASRPCVFSHSNPAHFFEMPRNVTDEQIRAVAQTGGLVGITPITPFFCKAGDPRPTVSNVVDHIAYVAELVGVDHVGLATDVPEGYSDFAWMTGAVRTYADTIKPRPLDTNACEGFANRTEFPNVTREMVRRGFSDEEIVKILGENWMRIYRSVWPAA